MAQGGRVKAPRPGPVALRLADADPAGLLYRAIISAVALATVSLHTPEAARVATATGAVLVISWMADLYVHALSARFEGGPTCGGLASAVTGVSSSGSTTQCPPVPDRTPHPPRMSPAGPRPPILGPCR